METLILLSLFQHYYLFMKIILLAGIVCFVLSLPQTAGLFRGITKRAWLLLFLIVLLGFILRMWVVPHTHQVYLDEFYHLNLAQNLLYHGSFGWCAEGTQRICHSFDFRFWPPVYHTLLSFLFGIFGDSEQVAFHFSAVVGALTPAVVFLFVFLLFDDEVIALLAAFLFNLIPVHLMYSGASELSALSIFFVLGALTAARAYANVRTPAHLALLGALTLIAVYTRAENVFLLFLVPFFVVFCRARGGLQPPPARHIGALLFVLAACSIPFILHIFYIGAFVLSEPGWNEDLMVYLGNLRRNVPLNLSFWFCALHPLSYTFLAFFGGVHVYRRDRRLFFFLAAWFVVFFLFISAVLRDFQHPYVDRFTLKLYIPVVIFAAAGLREIVRRSRFSRVLLVLLLAGIFLEAGVPFRFARDRTYGSDLYDEYHFVLSSKDKIPADVYVITYVPPEIISTIDRKAITFGRFFEMEEVPDKAILFKNSAWHDKMNLSSGFERRLREIYDFEVMDQAGPTPNGYVYSFVSLTKKPESLDGE